MNTLAFKVDGKNGDYVKPGLVPTNHSEEARFGWLDAAIIAFFLMCVSGLISLLLLS